MIGIKWKISSWWWLYITERFTLFYIFISYVMKISINLYYIQHMAIFPFHELKFLLYEWVDDAWIFIFFVCWSKNKKVFRDEKLSQKKFFFILFSPKKVFMQNHHRYDSIFKENIVCIAIIIGAWFYFMSLVLEYLWL